MQSFAIDPARWRIVHSFVRNPLVRLSDRIEAAVLIAVIIILIGAVPMAGAIGTATYESSSRALAAQAPTSHKVTATAIKDSGRQTLPYRTGPSAAWARWQINGDQHIGYLMWNRPRVRIGDQTEIWVNESGQRVAAPVWPALHAVALGVGSWLSCAAACIVGFALVRRRLNHIRRANWERELNVLADNNGRGRAHP